MTSRPQVIMVHPDEYEDAIAAGWLPEDIVRPTLVQVEGLRWEAMHITHQALEVIVGCAIHFQIEADQIRFDAVITIGHIKSKSPVRTIKELKFDSITITDGPNAFGYALEIKEK